MSAVQHAVFTALVIGSCAPAARTVDQDAYLNRTYLAHVRILQPGTVVLQTAEDLEAFWTAHHENNFKIPPEPPTRVPYVDFRRNMLIGVFWGARSGCRSGSAFVDRIGSVAHENDGLMVEVRELGSLGRCRAWSWPVQFIEVSRVPGGVVFTGVAPDKR